MNEPNFNAVRREFAALKNQEGQRSPRNTTNFKATLFNTFKAIMRMVCEDLSYITHDQLQHLEQLADQNDANIGAIYESYLHSDDLEDLINSCLLLLRYSKLADCSDGYLFAYQVLERNRMEQILKSVKTHFPNIDVDDTIKVLYRERSIITLYESIIGTEENQTKESLVELGQALQTEVTTVKARTKAFSDSLPTLSAVAPKKDISEIRAELFAQFASLDVSLSTKEHQIYKALLDDPREDYLQSCFKDFEKVRKDTTKKIQLFNKMIDDYLNSRLQNSPSRI